MDLEQFQQLNQKIKKTASDLLLSESMAAILLVKYEWNTALLYSDYTVLSQCARESEIVEMHAHCSLCHLYKLCRIINCGHPFCHDCFSASVTQQLSRNPLTLKCPSQTCLKFINFKNLPHDLLAQHLAALKVDLIKKTSMSHQCVSFVFAHKYVLATGFVSIGYALYTAFSWRKEIRYGLQAIHIGSELKAKASALKRVWTSIFYD